ncbi:MAG: nitrous oxide-stimulated promoter family protein [Erysipelotrichaceae bacterium]
MNTQIKRNKEIDIVKLMIQLYIKKHPEEMNDLAEYATNKIQKCPCMETKTFCSKCTIHCYDEKHHLQIKKVMRYSGPRMIFYHPMLTLKHYLPFL